MTVLANQRLIGGVAIALGKDGSGGELLGRGARQRPAGPGSSGGGGLPGCGLGTGSRHGVQSPYVKRVAVGRRGRKRVVEGKRVSVHVTLGGRRYIKKKHKKDNK